MEREVKREKRVAVVVGLTLGGAVIAYSVLSDNGKVLQSIVFAICIFILFYSFTFLRSIFDKMGFPNSIDGDLHSKKQGFWKGYIKCPCCNERTIYPININWAPQTCGECNSVVEVSNLPKYIRNSLMTLLVLMMSYRLYHLYTGNIPNQIILKVSTYLFVAVFAHIIFIHPYVVEKNLVAIGDVETEGK